MAKVKVIRPPLCGDAANDIPAAQWPLLIEERRNFCRDVFPDDCRMLMFFVDDASRAQWLGFKNREDYLSHGLGLNPQVVALALRGLQLTDPNKATPYDEAIILGTPGRPRKGTEKGRNPTILMRGRGYDLARLDRDYPQLAARVRSGELSANAAAIEAGFRKKPKRHCPQCGHEW